MSWSLRLEGERKGTRRVQTGRIAGWRAGVRVHAAEDYMKENTLFKMVENPHRRDTASS